MALIAIATRYLCTKHEVTIFSKFSMVPIWSHRWAKIQSKICLWCSEGLLHYWWSQILVEVCKIFNYDRKKPSKIPLSIPAFSSSPWFNFVQWLTYSVLHGVLHRYLKGLTVCGRLMKLSDLGWGQISKHCSSVDYTMLLKVAKLVKLWYPTMCDNMSWIML